MVRTRKNKSYTSILIDEMSIEAFKEAKKKVYDSIHGAKVIKPTKKALQAFVKLHSVALDTVETGGEYKILGTVFTVVRNLDYEREENEWYPIVRYYDRTKNRYEEFGIVSTNNFALGVHEHCFQNMTNTLLYY